MSCGTRSLREGNRSKARVCYSIHKFYLNSTKRERDFLAVVRPQCVVQCWPVHVGELILEQTLLLFYHIPCIVHGVELDG